MPVLRAIGLLFGGLVRVLFGVAARGAARRPVPGGPVDDLRHLRHLHAAACAADALAAVGVLRAVLAGGAAPRAGATLTAVGAALLLAALLALALRAPGALGAAARYLPALALAIRAALLWWLAADPTGVGGWVAAGCLFATALAHRVAVAAAAPAVAGDRAGETLARARVTGVAAGTVATPAGLVLLELGPRWPLMAAFVVCALGVLPALRLPRAAAPDAAAAPVAWPAVATAAAWPAMTALVVVPPVWALHRGGGAPVATLAAALAAGLLVGAAAGRRRPSRGNGGPPSRWVYAAPALTVVAAAGALVRPDLSAPLAFAVAGTGGVLTAAADRAAGVRAPVAAAVRACGVALGVAAACWVPAAAAVVLVGAGSAAVLALAVRARPPTADDARRAAATGAPSDVPPGATDAHARADDTATAPDTTAPDTTAPGTAAAPDTAPSPGADPATDAPAGPPRGTAAPPSAPRPAGVRDELPRPRTVTPPPGYHLYRPSAPPGGHPQGEE